MASSQEAGQYGWYWKIWALSAVENIEWMTLYSLPCISRYCPRNAIHAILAKYFGAISHRENATVSSDHVIVINWSTSLISRTRKTVPSLRSLKWFKYSSWWEIKAITPSSGGDWEHSTDPWPHFCVGLPGLLHGSGNHYAEMRPLIQLVRPTTCQSLDILAIKSVKSLL